VREVPGSSADDPPPINLKDVYDLRFDEADQARKEAKSHFPQHPLLVRAYLAFPPAWLLLGKQTLYLGEKPR
jgi:hypothetical protein